jgi:hypothetical protein
VESRDRSFTESVQWMADNPAVTAHINLLQGIINRLANNSASCKTWCLTLVGALLSLAGATHVPGIVTFALVAVVIFGLMDTMYLAEEIAYRDLYKSTVRAIRDGNYGRDNIFKAHAMIRFSNIISALACRCRRVMLASRRFSVLLSMLVDAFCAKVPSLRVAPSVCRCPRA